MRTGRAWVAVSDNWSVEWRAVHRHGTVWHSQSVRRQFPVCARADRSLWEVCYDTFYLMRNCISCVNVSLWTKKGWRPVNDSLVGIRKGWVWVLEGQTLSVAESGKYEAIGWVFLVDVSALRPLQCRLYVKNSIKPVKTATSYSQKFFSWADGCRKWKDAIKFQSITDVDRWKIYSRISNICLRLIG